MFFPREKRSRGVSPRPPPVALRTPFEHQQHQQRQPQPMRIVEAPPVAPGRRPGRRPLELSQLRSFRVDVDLSAAELAQCQMAAGVAELPLRRWARRVLLGHRVSAAQPAELRRMWTASSTLQSNFNQLVARLAELRAADELNAATASDHLVALLAVVPDLHSLVRDMRLQLASLKAAS